MNEDDIRTHLREMRDDPVPPDSLARVRMRVEDRTRRRPFGLWWKAALVIAPLLLFFVLMPRSPRPEPAAPPRPIARVERPPAPPPPVKPAPPPRRPLLRATPPPRPSRPSPVIRIETEDPDVVILLIAE